MFDHLFPSLYGQPGHCTPVFRLHGGVLGWTMGALKTSQSQEHTQVHKPQLGKYVVYSWVYLIILIHDIHLGKNNRQ